MSNGPLFLAPTQANIKCTRCGSLFRSENRVWHCRETLTALGPSFIKAGQVLASRPDIIREDYMNELCILQVTFCTAPTLAPCHTTGVLL